MTALLIYPCTSAESAAISRRTSAGSSVHFQEDFDLGAGAGGELVRTRSADAVKLGPEGSLLSAVARKVESLARAAATSAEVVDVGSSAVSGRTRSAEERALRHFCPRQCSR